MRYRIRANADWVCLEIQTALARSLAVCAARDDPLWTFTKAIFPITPDVRAGNDAFWREFDCAE